LTVRLKRVAHHLCNQTAYGTRANSSEPGSPALDSASWRSPKHSNFSRAQKKKKKKKKTQIFFKPKMSLSAGRKAAAASAPKLPALLARLRAYPDDPVLPLKQKDASGARVPVREVLSRCAAEAKLKPAEIAAEMEAARGLMESRWLHTVRDGGDGIDPRIHSELQ
jgi:hypothetical protein